MEFEFGITDEWVNKYTTTNASTLLKHSHRQYNEECNLYN